LRQPLHALGLFVAQLRMPLKSKERAKMVERIDAAVGEMDDPKNRSSPLSALRAAMNFNH